MLANTCTCTYTPHATTDNELTTDAHSTDTSLTICEVKTPAFSLELLHGVFDVIIGDDTHVGGVTNLDLPCALASVIPSLTPVHPLKCPVDKLNRSPSPSPGHLTGKTPSSVTRAVC